MRRIVLAGSLAAAALILAAAGCGGAQVPAHSGYKSAKAKPWVKPKKLAWNDKLEAEDDGELDYAAYKRSRWYAVDLSSAGELTLQLEVTPPGDAVNEDFDLAMEVLDPGYRVISKADLEEEDAGELNKMRKLRDLSPGRYLIHLYLQGRMDVAEYELKAEFKPAGLNEIKSDFPAKVAFLPTLPMVPVNDDTPTKPEPKPRTTTRTTRPKPPKKDEPAQPPATTMTARILGVSVSGGKTQVTVGLGTTQGVAAGWKAKVAGVSGTFSVTSCNARTCIVHVSATPDQVKAGGGNVTLSP